MDGWRVAHSVMTFIMLLKTKSTATTRMQRMQNPIWSDYLQSHMMMQKKGLKKAWDTPPHPTQPNPNPPHSTHTTITCCSSRRLTDTPACRQLHSAHKHCLSTLATRCTCLTSACCRLTTQQGPRLHKHGWPCLAQCQPPFFMLQKNCVCCHTMRSGPGCCKQPPADPHCRTTMVVVSMQLQHGGTDDRGSAPACYLSACTLLQQHRPWCWLKSNRPGEIAIMVHKRRATQRTARLNQHSNTVRIRLHACM